MQRVCPRDGLWESCVGFSGSRGCCRCHGDGNKLMGEENVTNRICEWQVDCMMLLPGLLVLVILTESKVVTQNHRTLVYSFHRFRKKRNSKIVISRQFFQLDKRSVDPLCQHRVNWFGYFEDVENQTRWPWFLAHSVKRIHVHMNENAVAPNSERWLKPSAHLK